MECRDLLKRLKVQRKSLKTAVKADRLVVLPVVEKLWPEVEFFRKLHKVTALPV